MATKAEKAGDTAAGKTTPIDPQSVDAASQKTQQGISEKDVEPATPGDPGVPRSEHVQALEKARSEEKKKLYPDLERLRQEKTEGAARIEELQSELAAKHSEVEALRVGEMEKSESVNKELRELQEKNLKLEAAIEAVAESAAARIRASELSAYREKAIAAAGLDQLEALVAGGSVEEIDASVAAAKEKELAILEKARAEVRTQIAKTLPEPISPDGTAGRGTSPGITPLKKVEGAKLKGAEYRALREQLLREAKQQAGLP